MNVKARRLATAGTAAAVLATGGAAWVSSPASAVSAVIPRCSASQVAVWVNADSANGAAGSVYYHLDFTNTSGATCHLYGYPGVSALSGSGAQLGSAAGRDSAAPAGYVNIVPGGTAHSVLRVVQTGDYPAATCQPTAASRLRVYPPGDTGARHALFDLSSCAKAGPVYLSVEVVQPGT
jgi:hypothetical protein